jgi:hypothetical protein
VDRSVRFAREFEEFVTSTGIDKKDIDLTDFVRFVEQLETNRGIAAKTYLWALAYYFEFNTNDYLKSFANDFRQERIGRRPFQVVGFRGIEGELLDRLSTVAIMDISQMINAGSTPERRPELSQSSGIDESKNLEITKLSELARIPGSKGNRARLYFDAGIDTLDMVAKADPEKLRVHLVAFVEETESAGIATLPNQIVYSIQKSSTFIPARRVRRVSQDSSHLHSSIFPANSLSCL